ncbi:MAG TPA: prephenate dehydratase [Solirubrobacteraceae bacterium]|nr:prephenate dehydratase [Solirubrobacteraceae bacterium]
MRAGFLGPSGTNSHAALAAAPGDWEPVALPTVAAAVRAVQTGELPRALVPIENSREGGVGATLDALVFDAPDVVIVGELVHRVSYCLAAADRVAPDEIRTVHSHPQASAQCAAFLREHAPAAAIVAASSTADAVRAVAAGDMLAGAAPHAAIGTRHAAELYGAVVLAEGIEDDEENATRFAWLARRVPAGDDRHVDGAATPGHRPHAGAAPRRETKTALVFWGAGDRAPGWLVACLGEFASREINLTRIESRPRRVGLGHYMFFCDLEGDARDPLVAGAIAGLRGHCEAVRVLGSFPAAS